MRRILFVVFVVVAMALAGCQETTTDDFINPPPGVPATCTVIGDLPGCDQGSISYSCTSDRPDDVGSDAGKGDTAQLVCSDGAVGPDGTGQFCCIPFSQYFTDCAVDDAIPGCGATSVGFACSGQGASPSDADPTIACGAAQVGSDGVARYCCNTATVPEQCVVEPTATCGGIAVAYTCVDGATPADGDPTLACGAGGVGEGGTSYCCVPFAASAETCTPDATQGCAAGELGFVCGESNTPDGLDPALACTATERGYCCTVQP